jgi:hypothetical protein
MTMQASSGKDAPPKAFLSHSSKDSELVHAVAAQVGRPFVKLDVNEFQGGDEILTVIDEAVEQSAVFVLFASRASLASLWVGAEVDAARYELRFGRLKHVLVCLLDDTLGSSDLPTWMRRYKYIPSRAAKPIARAIRAIIDEMIRDRQSEFFVNRLNESARLQDIMAPASGLEPATLFAVVGLDGIGRRTLLQRVSRDILSLPRIIEVEIESGDSVNDIAVKIADLLEPASSPEDAVALAKTILSLPESEAAERAAHDLRLAVGLRELPTLVDRGGLLDNEGQLTDGVRGILSAVGRSPEVVVALVSARRPEQSDGTQIPSVRVADLDDADVRRLVGLLARARDLDLTKDNIAVLAGMSRGYPPSARIAVELGVY